MGSLDSVEAADADKFYTAWDLMQLEVNSGATVYVAYDASLPVPDWLLHQFRPTPSSFTIANRPMKVFAGNCKPMKALRSGSNTPDNRFKSCNMYVVFVKPGDSSYSASR